MSTDSTGLAQRYSGPYMREPLSEPKLVQKVNLRRPQIENRWWSVPQELWDKLLANRSEKHLRALTHTGLIMETSWGMEIQDKCTRCEEEGGDCSVYIAEAASFLVPCVGPACARCRYNRYIGIKGGCSKAQGRKSVKGTGAENAELLD